MSKTVNAGKYSKKIKIYKIVIGKDQDGFPVPTEQIILTPYASVKTTKGYTIIKNNSDFEKALVNFTIRYSVTVVDAYYDSEDSNRQMFIDYKNKTFTIEYMNNIDMENHELEMQCKEVMK